MSNQTITMARVTQTIQLVSNDATLMPLGATWRSHKKIAVAPMPSASRAATPSAAIFATERWPDSTGMNACSQTER
jgi:hypothetical protein